MKFADQPYRTCCLAILTALLLLMPTGRAARAEDTLQIATEAYIYGYPLVTMDMTRRVITNVAAPEGTRAPMGQLIKMRQYPNAAFRDVTAPNADTLYTTAFFDVGKEPWILSLPDMKGRYYLMPMLDGWTDVFQVPGKRTTGTGAQIYAITGPGWSGTLPSGIKQYKSPTSIVWLLGRIYCTGTPEDYAEVHALQDQVKLVPLSAYGKPYTPAPGTVDPSIDMKKAVRDQVNAMSTVAFFNYLAKLMKDNPPAAADAPMLAKMAKIGLVPGQDFDSSKLGLLDEELVKAVPKFAMVKILEYFRHMKPVNGWVITTKTGIYGTDYVQRALITAIGLGANRPQDAIYPTSKMDVNGKHYDGASKKYVMHFARGQMPPVNGFWSLTMYDSHYFFVPNSLNRYTLSQRDKFVTNADGSVDLYLQADSPGEAKEANWLPAPKGGFVPMLRLYWPREQSPSILNGSWKPPAIKAVE
ncbi:MAG TPA: DUF1254 domain-containing protein [Candidatus Binataceae bacterium]|nr:DUF1254 domain-containing protein [Candidatus Binataceae bacterium]